MPKTEILGSGRIDERESAFPQAVQLPDGDLLCSFSVGGGAFVDGGTDWARSTDGGRTWTLEGTILPPDPDKGKANFLKLSLSGDGNTVYAYGALCDDDISKPFGQRATRAILCRSEDGGRSWSEPSPIPMLRNAPLEISHGVLPLNSGRLLAPAATLPAADRLGEEVYVSVSDDDGRTWPEHRVVLKDSEAKFGFFEQKLAEIEPGRVMATAWTVTLGDYVDQPNSFAISNDNGDTWGHWRSTGIMGQTMTPIPLGSDRLLVLYNRRYGQQAVLMCLVTFTDETWIVHDERVMYDARAHHERAVDVESGIDELGGFEFGFPTAHKLQDGTFLATHWSVENQKCGIRWTRLRVDW